MSGEVVICLQWPCNLGGKHIHPENKLLSAESLNSFFVFCKKPDVTFHVLIRLFIRSHVFPWMHKSTTMQSRWTVCGWFWMCVCCIHKEQLCTWALRYVRAGLCPCKACVLPLIGTSSAHRGPRTEVQMRFKISSERQTRTRGMQKKWCLFRK